MPGCKTGIVATGRRQLDGASGVRKLTIRRYKSNDGGNDYADMYELTLLTNKGVRIYPNSGTIYPATSTGGFANLFDGDAGTRWQSVCDVLYNEGTNSPTYGFDFIFNTGVNICTIKMFSMDASNRFKYLRFTLLDAANQPLWTYDNGDYAGVQEGGQWRGTLTIDVVKP